MAARGFTYHFVQGASEPFDFQLRDAGDVIVGTGLTLGLALYRDGGAISGVSVAWLDQAAGTVRVTGHESLDLGEYQARFALTDGAGKIGHVPNGPDADRWLVVAVNA